jgi:signal transduction histidine kinase
MNAAFLTTFGGHTLPTFSSPGLFMRSAPIPSDESQRLATLQAYHILDTAPEASFDELTALAAELIGCPISLISLIDEHRQWFKSRHGLDVQETPREQAFCAHTLEKPDEVLVVANALEDERFVDNPLVTGNPKIRFYAGAPLVAENGQVLGTLCTIDNQPRELSAKETRLLQLLGRQVTRELELRRLLVQSLAQQQELQATQAELLRTSKLAAIGEMISMIAHQWRQPLSLISTGVSAVKLKLRLQGQLSTELEQQLKRIKDTTQFLSGTIRDFRTFFRPENEPELLTLQEVLEPLIPLWESSAQESGVQFVGHFDAQLPPLWVYRAEMQQVLIGLVQNAQEAFVRNQIPHPCLKLFTRAEASLQVVEIHDNAGGIPPELRDRIWEPYFSTKEERNHTGLGLHMARMVVEEHQQGKLEVQPLAEGTCVRLALPAAE